MNKLTMLALTTALAFTTANVFAETSNNGQANASGEAGQVAPDAHQNMAPNNVGNGDINTSGMSDSPAVGGSMNSHDRNMCKDGHCPGMNKEMKNKPDPQGDGENTKTYGETQK